MHTRLDYARLTDIVKQVKPFRKTENEYPIGMRTQTYKRFSAEKDAEGDTFFRIYYGYIWNEVEVNAEQYALIKKWGGRAVTEADGSKKYYTYEQSWNDIGIVRKDNTLELTANHLHQGTRYFLSNMFNRYGTEVISSVRHGGVIYREFEGNYKDGYTSTKIIPLFKGQRISLDTCTSVLDYEVHLSKVNRTKSKEVLAEYEDPLKLTELLFKTMTPEVFVDSLKEVFVEAMPEPDEGSRWLWRNAIAARKMMDYATAQVKADIFKSVCATMMGEGIYNAWSIGSDNSYPNNVAYEPEDFFKLAKQKIIKRIRQGSGALDVRVFKPNEPYPSSNWDITVSTYGKQIQTY